MNLRLGTSLCVVSGVTGLLCVAWVSSAEPPGDSTDGSKSAGKQVSVEPPDDQNRVSVTAARDCAKLMHSIYAATLDTIHHHYFRSDRSVLPARAMEDVFAEMARQSQVKARWISVNTKAMSIHHEPQNEFERQAAAELAAGKAEFELVENGVYHRAGPIPLGAGCVGCHTKIFASPAKSPRFAGLVISVPVNDD
jgi:hypothetical protein